MFNLIERELAEKIVAMVVSETDAVVIDHNTLLAQNVEHAVQIKDMLIYQAYENSRTFGAVKINKCSNTKKWIVEFVSK